MKKHKFLKGNDISKQEKLQEIENKCKNLQKIINSFGKKNPEKAKIYQSLLNKIFEKINQKKIIKHTLFPKNKKELQQMIIVEIKKQGNNANLNHIDVSEIDDMSNLFEGGPLFVNEFIGDISEWNVSNVINMQSMFSNSKFNGNISFWNVSKVENMEYMFNSSQFNQDISHWNVKNVKYMEGMFQSSQFNKDISIWDVSNVRRMNWMFANSQFNQDISNWNISKVGIYNKMDKIFVNSPLAKKTPKWYKDWKKRHNMKMKQLYD